VYKRQVEDCVRGAGVDQRSDAPGKIAILELHVDRRTRMDDTSAVLLDYLVLVAVGEGLEATRRRD